MRSVSSRIPKKTKHFISWSSGIWILLHIHKWTVTKPNKHKNPSNGQSATLKRERASLTSRARRIWPSEDRIGWGSCKLPNNPSARLSTPQDITKVHVYYVPQQLLMLTLPGLSNILTNLLWSWHSNAAEPPQSEKQELRIGKDESVNKSIADSFTNGK